MAFGKDSSFHFVMQGDKLVSLARADVTADKQPFDSIEKEVWRIFGEHRELQAENKRLRELLIEAEPRWAVSDWLEKELLKNEKATNFTTDD